MLKEKVAMTPAWQDGCALVRMFMPHLHIPNSDYVFTGGPIPYDSVADAKIIMVQRLCTQDNYLALQNFKKLGFKIVYDLDDDLWSIPSANPAKRLLESVKHGFVVCAELADVITVSTESLKTAVSNHMKGLAKRIEVVENAIDFDLYSPIPVKKDKVVVGWGGSNTHNADLQNVWDALRKVVATDENFYVEFVGTAPPSDLLRNPRVAHKPWAPVYEYPARYSYWQWDVVLAPLEDNRFNKSKSSVKALEAATIGSPILMSPVRPYTDLVNLDSRLVYLLCTTQREWREKILELTRDPSLRGYYGGILRDVVRKHHNVVDRVTQWEDVFNSLV